MKLNYFSSQTLPNLRGGSSKAAKVSFGKAGAISFNGTAAELMGLTAGDKLTLAQDETEPANWFFFKDKEHGFEVRTGYDKKGVLFNHATLVKTFNDCFGFPKETKQYLIAGQPTLIKGSKTEYWGMLVNGSPVEDEL